MQIKSNRRRVSEGGLWYLREGFFGCIYYMLN